MGVRVFSLTTAAVLAVATFAWATQGDPVGGIGVSIESSPGGIVSVSGATNAEGNVVWRAPTPGTYLISLSGPTAVAACGRVVADPGCQEAPRKGRGICIGSRGGAFSAATGPADGPGLVVSVRDASGGLVAAQWAACDALTTGQPKAKATLAPIVLDRTKTKGPLTIGVGYVAKAKPRS